MRTPRALRGCRAAVRMTGTWLSHPREDAGARLFCFPYAGGSSSAFRQWTRDLAPETDVLPLRLPGHVGRLREPAPSSLDEIIDGSVQAIRPLVDRPFSLFGVSMGALVAFETARVLTELGHPPDHLYVASFPSPELVSGGESTSDLSDEEFLRVIRGLGATPPGIADDPEMVAMLLPSLRADFDATARHVDSGSVLESTPITALHGEGDLTVQLDDMRRWSGRTRAAFELVQVEGGHFFVHQDSPIVLDLIRQCSPPRRPVMDRLSDRVAALDSSERQRLLERVRARRAERTPRRAESRGRLRFSLFFFGTGEGRDIEDHYRLVFDCARFADENGFEAVWVPERHFDVFGAPYPSPAVLAAGLAAATRRLEVRAGSVVVPLHDPVRVAEDWAVVDSISGGRAGMALASGWHANDFVLAPDRFDDRKQVLVDDLATIRALWRGDEITRTDGAGNEVSLRTYPTPRRGDLPLWITSSSSEQTWRTGAELGLNVLTGLVEQSVEDVRDRVQIYREALATAGRDPKAHTVTAMVHTFIGSDLESVRDEVRGPLTAYLRAHIGLYEKLVRSADLNLDADKVTDADKDALAEVAFTRYFATHGLFGAPEDALQTVHRLVDAGVDEVGCLVDFGLPPSRVLEHLKHLATLKELADQELPNDATVRDHGQRAE